MIRAVLFDLDGTLADTAPDLGAALNRVRAAQGLSPLPLDETRPYTSMGARGMLKAGFGLEPSDPAYEPLKEQFLSFYEASLCEGTRLFEGMDELLSELEAKGLAWGVVTNKAARFTEPLLGRLGIRDRAACIVSGDTAGRAKPYPDPLLHAARSMNLEPAACLYVGDDLRDVQAARAAGMPVLAAAYGYLGAEGDPHAWNADAVITHPLETLNFLAPAPSMG